MLEGELQLDEDMVAQLFLWPHVYKKQLLVLFINR